MPHASHRVARERGGGKLMCDDSLGGVMSCYPASPQAGGPSLDLDVGLN